MNNMTSPTLLVLAAGMGSRYGGIKQMDPVGPGGEFVLDYSVYDAWRAGFSKVVFVIREELEGPLREHFGAHLDGKIEAAYVHQRLDDLPPAFSCPAERSKPWGTGHAVWSARAAVTTPFGMINADDFYGRGAYRILAEFLRQRTAAETDYCMVAYRLDNTLSKYGPVSRGICSVDENGLLTGVAERTKIDPAPGGARFMGEDGEWGLLTGREPASLNLWGFTPRLFPQMTELFTEFLERRIKEPRAEFYIPAVVDELIRREACRTTVLHTDEHWFGMTYREDHERVTRDIATLIREGVYPECLWD
jgi:UTP-glucose-1-phosphate uridylyltransferase